MTALRITQPSTSLAALLTAALVLIAAPLGGCRGERTDKPPRQFFPDMDNQQRWDPQETTESTMFADERTARPVVPNTVPFGRASFDPTEQGERKWAESFMQDRRILLANEPAFARGVTGEQGGTDYVDIMPVEVTMELLAEGRKEFNTYCAACHGYEGDGQGMVGRRWSYPPANISGGVYADRAQRKGKDGYLFHVIREGVWDPATGANRMPGYKAQLDEMEAWAVVAYLRALQRAQDAGPADLTESERDRLNITVDEGGAS